MWLYSATLLTVVAYVVCSSIHYNTRKRANKLDENRIVIASHRRRNRLSADDMEIIQVPMKIPKLTKAQKIALIIESGQNPYEKKRHHGRRRKGKRRSRHVRHLDKRNPAYAYQFLDDDDGDVEARWADETAHAAHWDDQQQQQQEHEVVNPVWEAETGAVTPQSSGHELEWGKTPDPFDASHWETSTPSYWETSTPPYWETSTPAYWETSTPTYWETSTPYYDPYWQEPEISTAEPDSYWTTTTTPDTTTTTTTTTEIAPTWDAPAADTEVPIWRRLFVVTTTPAPNQPLALPITNCPHRFDAVTRAFNGRTYVFARDRVYQVWRHDNLHQKASFFVNEMFPEGPRTVTVAYTNQRSGVTVLIEHKTVYRYRWDRKNKVFYGDNFATYDAYWNVITFSGLTSNYFPQFPRDLIGMTYQNDALFVLYTASNKIQIYDTVKYRVLQEYPIEISEFVGCSRS